MAFKALDWLVVGLALLAPCTALGQVPPAASAAQSEAHAKAEWAAGNNRIQAALNRQDLAGAVREAEQALAFARDAFGEGHSTTFVSSEKLAFLYEHVGRSADAEPLRLWALKRREVVLGPDAPETLSAVNELGVRYFERGDYGKAEPLLLRGLNGRRSSLGEDHPETVAAKNNLAALYERQGRYSAAEPLLLAVVEASEARAGRAGPDTLAALNNLAVLYNSEGRHAEAEPLLARVAAARETALGVDHPDTLLALSNLAALYEARGRHQDAEQLQRRVLTAREQRLGDHRDTAVSLTNLASSHRRQGRLPEAEALLLRALRIRKALLGPAHADTLAAMNNLAAVYSLEQRYDLAETLLKEALSGLGSTVGYEHPDAVEVAVNLALLRLTIRQDAKGATEAARLAVTSIRARRAEGLGDYYRDAEREREERRRGDYFALLADATWSANSHGGLAPIPLDEEAFAALQDASNDITSRAVARTAARRLADDASSGLGAVIKAREGLEARWRSNGRRYSEALSERGSDADALRAMLAQERLGLEMRLDALNAELQQRFPRYFDFAQPTPLRIRSLQTLLAPDEAALLVVPSAFGTHVAVVTRVRARWLRSSWTRDQVNRAVRRLRWDLDAPTSISPAEAREWAAAKDAGFSFDRKTAFALYQQLVAPVAADLAGKRHVFVAASGALAGLPFGVLVTEPPEGSDADPSALRRTKWLADAYGLVQVPSVPSLALLRQARPKDEPASPKAPAPFLGFGDPRLGAPVRPSTAGKPPERGLADVARLAGMDPLPGTATEIHRLATALGAREAAVFLGERATEARLKALDPIRVDVLALATHGLVAGELGRESEPGLVLTPPPAASRLDDGLLTASEIAALNMTAEWVIMSACNTAAGDGSTETAGLSGLARAFFYAGARTLLASHWPVRDDVAAILTVRTLEILRREPGVSRPEALQRAMREVRNDASHDTPDDSWAHPNAWAPFTVIGDIDRH